MDHTNIAKVLDAGTTPAGRPYFVMELIKGVPITKYCDELDLPVRERLELFVPVCKAIQHAHGQGVVHRDIKPSNVLVCMEDGKAVPKIIDFGVAKALQTRLTNESLHTEIGQLIGTLEYMAPEQAELSALEVDARADVYALGVLLYELLTGTTPLDKTRLRTAAFAELIRMIREEEPPKPSTRVSEGGGIRAEGGGRREEGNSQDGGRRTEGGGVEGVTRQQRRESARLAREVRGELDWIVMRCLEKDRTRRYSSAAGLALDIERHLRDEAVEACPPRARYRVGKFVRRHRAAIVAAAAVFFMLVAGLMGTTWAFLQAERERRMALRAEQAARLMQAEQQRADMEAKAVQDFLEQGLRSGGESDKQAGQSKEMNRTGDKTKP